MCWKLELLFRRVNGRLVTARAREFSFDESRLRLRNGFAFYNVEREDIMNELLIASNNNNNNNKDHTRKSESSEFRVLRIDHSLESSSLTLIQRALKCGTLSKVRKYLSIQTK